MSTLIHRTKNLENHLHTPVKPFDELIGIIYSTSSNNHESIGKLVRKHFESLIEDLLVNPSHNHHYQKLEVKLSFDKASDEIQKAISYVKNVALHLINYDLQGLENIAQQLISNHISQDAKLTGILKKFSSLKLPKNIEEIRAICHPHIKAHLMAFIINRDNVPVKDLGLTKDELMQMAPHLSYFNAVPLCVHQVEAQDKPFSHIATNDQLLCLANKMIASDAGTSVCVEFL